MSESRTHRARSKKSAKMYQLKITLPDLPVWRRLLVRGDMNLGLLHAVIQVAMGWTNSHLHRFFIGNDRYTDPTMGGEVFLDDTPELDEGKATLMKVVPLAKAKFIYEYDFGDSWVHRISVEKIHEADAMPKDFAQCLDGAFACPPEDCGGIGGYAYLLEVIKDPEHERHYSMMEWLGGEFDPDAFDIEKANACLRMLKWPRTTESRLAEALMARDGILE